MLIRPPGFRGAAFTTAVAGDMSSGDRGEVSGTLGIRAEWASLRQVHGSDVLAATEPGRAGPGDALVTGTRYLPLAVMTADCVGVVLETEDAVGVAHAGWRGVVAGVVAAAARRLEGLGRRPGPVLRAAMGPLIGPCCFEVGPEVAGLFHDRHVKSIGGMTTVDLATAVRDQVPEADWWSVEACTRCEEGWFSFRADRTEHRLAALGWIP
ncbi:MAG: polyphenol oxidase family protein [Acidimicrobiia bacterium]|nr:polyphenol oxidase family protein [Acidimicrobiia bacterium]MYF83274.1 polyphenol oxidase family protein [Acidimicrobiia bacterium]